MKEVMLDLERQEIGDICRCRVPDNVPGMFRADIDVPTNIDLLSSGISV